MKRFVTSVLLAAPFAVALFALAGGAVGDAAWLGMTVEEMDDGVAVELGVPANAGQVVVVQVEGPALAAGVIVGDLVRGINSQKVQSVSDFLKTARDATSTRQTNGKLPDVVLSLNRLGSPLTVVVPSEWVESYLRQ